MLRPHPGGLHSSVKLHGQSFSYSGLVPGASSFPRAVLGYSVFRGTASLGYSEFVPPDEGEREAKEALGDG
jgi:hypothetical protein